MNKYGFNIIKGFLGLKPIKAKWEMKMMKARIFKKGLGNLSSGEGDFTDKKTCPAARLHLRHIFQIQEITSLANFFLYFAIFVMCESF